MADLQRSLFPEDITRKKIGEVQESREAFDRVAPAISSLKQKVLFYAAARPGGVTLHGVMRDLKLSYPTASARLAELQKEGMLEKSGRRGKCAIRSITALGRDEVSRSAT